MCPQIQKAPEKKAGRMLCFSLSCDVTSPFSPTFLSLLCPRVWDVNVGENGEVTSHDREKHSILPAFFSGAF